MANTEEKTRRVLKALLQCGIPYAPPVVPDAVNGTKLTFDQAVAHVGGVDNLVSGHGRRLIDLHARQYLWKYPDKTTWCTACGHAIRGVMGSHGRVYACPLCGATCEFRYEAKGHSHLTDAFYLYEWRRSVLDPETIVLTGAQVYRNSTHPRPHEAKLEVEPTALYVFRPGRAVTVYKQRWHYSRNGMEGQWTRIDSVHPEHTQWGAKPQEIVIDHMEFLHAIEGTRIGKLFTLLQEESGRWDDLELSAIANCARRPWLEYVYKSGLRYLAGQLLREDTVSRDICPNLRARTPRELLGLTEAQWFEIRRDNICLTMGGLRALRAMTELDIGPVKVADAMRLAAGTDAAWHIRRYMVPEAGFEGKIGNRLARLPGKRRRKILRHILGDLRHAHDWMDYYGQLERLRQLPTEAGAFTECDMALLMPRDMMAMHQRMTDRENAIRREKRLAELAARQDRLAKRLDKLRKAYTFQAAGLVLRPYESVTEVVDEGAALHICIGSYTERYADGGTVLCCLRRAEEPDEPWRAVEFSAETGRMVQDRGAYNDSRGNGIPPGVRAQLRNFWAAWNRAHPKNEKGVKSA